MMNINSLRHKKILVTGGAGFIGSNLCEYLVKIECYVNCLDNFSTGKKENISHLLGSNYFNLIEGDIRNLDTCLEASNGCDFVLHQAALGSVPRSIKDPITTNDVNVNGFLNMLISSKNNKIKKFIYASSSSVYGDSIKLPKVEEEIGNQLSPYAISKYINELYAKNFSEIFKINTIGLRYFNVFGPRQDPSGPYAAVIPKFINSFINLESPVINGKGDFSRDFTYVSNVVNMNLLALINQNDEIKNHVYNVACGDRITILEMTQIIKNYMSKYDSKINEVNILFGDERDGDIAHSNADIKKAIKLLNYKPTINFRDGIQETIDWFLKNIN